MPRQRPDLPDGYDWRKAVYAMAILLHYAGDAREMPKREDWGLSLEEADDVQNLINEAIANSGGYVPEDSPPHT
jgi:hypothetical protein